MLQRLRKGREEGGFTLIELLVVILIVAILAAVAIPVFLKQREKGYVDQMQSALKNASTAAESYATANNGAYPADGAITTAAGALDAGAVGVAFGAEGYSPTKDVEVIFDNLGSGAYCISANHSSHGTSYKYMSAKGSPEADTNDTCP